MGEINKYFMNIVRSCTSIFEGMAITLSWMFRKPHTVQYPDRMGCTVAESITDGFRGLLEVDTGLCTGCLLCARTCPIDVITIEATKLPDGTRALTRFDINASSCMYCGLCTEACATGAIRHTKQFEFAVDDIRKLHLHFVTGEPVPIKKVDPDSVEVRPASGTILQPFLDARDLPYQPPATVVLPAVTQAGE